MEDRSLIQPQGLCVPGSDGCQLDCVGFLSPVVSVCLTFESCSCVSLYYPALVCSCVVGLVVSSSCSHLMFLNSTT